MNFERKFLSVKDRNVHALLLIAHSSENKIGFGFGLVPSLRPNRSRLVENTVFDGDLIGPVTAVPPLCHRLGHFPRRCPRNEVEPGYRDQTLAMRWNLSISWDLGLWVRISVKAGLGPRCPTKATTKISLNPNRVRTETIRVSHDYVSYQI